MPELYPFADAALRGLLLSAAAILWVIEQVRAVVLETTGDISVLHGDRLQEAILIGAADRRHRG